MSKTLSCLVVGSLAVVAVGCAPKDDSLSFLTNHAVGTYIGGGSIFGADSCSYTGTPAVFLNDAGKPSAEPGNGPRFVFAAGTITKECNGDRTSVSAVVPTGAKMSGPSKLKVGVHEVEPFDAHLVANGKELGGEAYLDWKLGNDCTGIAEFEPVMGAQDTGGRDRVRRLQTKGKGTCTVIVGLTTGSPLNGSFKPESFQTEKLVTIE